MVASTACQQLGGCCLEARLMKVLLFSPQLVGGGAQQVAILLAAGLLARGHEVCICAGRLSGPLLERVPAGCQLQELGSDRPIRGRKALARLVDSFRPDAVVCFGIFTGIAAGISRLGWRHQPVFVLRNENNLVEDWRLATPMNRVIGPWLSRWVARKACMVAVSRALSPATADYLHIPRSRVTTILNPVIDDTVALDMDEAGLHPWLRDQQEPVFVAMGRLEHQKGFDVLIHAFERVREAAACRLVIFGEGTLREALIRQIDEAGLSGWVTLAGHTDSPLAQMRAAHAFVLSSRFEGFGLVLVEALWAGTRVISTDCDFGPAELLEDGRYGVLVPPEDAGALAEAMLASLHAQPAAVPDSPWFNQFLATTAADQHVALIEAELARR